MVIFPFLSGHSILNHAEVIASDRCGCYKCLSVFTPNNMTPDDWWEESNGQLTAACPNCGIDSVIGSASGYTINREVLKAIHAERFGLYWAFARNGSGYDVYDGGTGTWDKEKL